VATDSGGQFVSEYAYWRLSRFTVPDGQMAADANSEVVLVQQFDQQMWHDAGCMMFGPDGFLYFSCGDEGGANDQYNATQTLSERLMSGIFRIDVNQNPALSHAIRRQPFHHPAMPAGWPESYTTNYFVPNDNPFVNTNGANLEEYYALGFRQPYRFSRDPVTGLIWVADSGQSTREEIDILVPGANYRWAYREGTFAGPKSAPGASLVSRKIRSGTMGAIREAQRLVVMFIAASSMRDS
jgi:glucose/arabinose dehydrogenase